MEGLAAFLPVADARMRRPEDRYVAKADLDLSRETVAELLDTRPRAMGPDTQYVGKVVDCHPVCHAILIPSIYEYSNMCGYHNGYSDLPFCNTM
jgi:hypothetical protein